MDSLDAEWCRGVCTAGAHAGSLTRASKESRRCRTRGARLRWLDPPCPATTFAERVEGPTGRSIRWYLIVKVVEAHTDAVRVVLYAERWLKARCNCPAAPCRNGIGDSSKVRCLASTGNHVRALRVRYLVGPGVPYRPVRALYR
jgi:hypothetical protein